MNLRLFRTLAPVLSRGRPKGLDPLLYSIIKLGRATKKASYFRNLDIGKERARLVTGSGLVNNLRNRFNGGTGGETLIPVSDTEIQGTHGPIPLRLYTGSSPRELILFFHGGGWVLGSIDTADFLCEWLTEDIGATVVSVGYHLAPEHPYPAAVDDAVTALEWARGQGFTEITVCGTSAGGTIAAAVCLRAKAEGLQPPARQLLIHPPTDLASIETKSYRSFGSMKLGLSRAQMEWFIACYLKGGIDSGDGFVSPLRAEGLKGLPPAMIISAEFDVLRDEAEAYAERLDDAGVRTLLIRAEGMTHGFLNFSGIIPAAGEWMRHIAGEYRRFRDVSS